MMTRETTDRGSTLRALRRARPRCRFVRGSAWAALLLAAAVWLAGGFEWGELLSARRWDNVQRFLHEAVPYPLRDGDPSTGFAAWAAEIFLGRGVPAAVTTVAISVAGIVLAGALALAVIPLAARNIATARPFAVNSAPGARSGYATAAGRRSGDGFWTAVRSTARGFFILARAIPEYVLAFLFLALLGPHAWPLVLALAVHNFGILGRLGSETLEDLPPQPLAHHWVAGLGRTKTWSFAALPAAANRFLVYFFYRWETCLRDATVLGMLGLTSLGFLIDEARARLRYDEMLAFVLIGVLLVGVGDLVSIAARRTANR